MITFIKNCDDSEVVGRVIEAYDNLLYADVNGNAHVIQDQGDNPRHERYNVPGFPDEFELISWEYGQGPDLDELGRVVALGHRCFWYVHWGSDAWNMLCARTHDPLGELNNDSRDLIGLALFEVLTS